MNIYEKSLKWGILKLKFKKKGSLTPFLMSLFRHLEEKKSQILV